MDIAITGSIAYDYIMRFPGKFEDHIIPDKIDKISLSFLVDDMTKHWGGVAPNIAYTLGLLQQQPSPKLIGTAGKDFGDYRQWLESAGVDTTGTIQIDEVFTASFFVNTDNVNNQIASFYTGAMAFAKDYTLVDLLPQKPDIVVVSPNDPTAMQQFGEECKRDGIPMMYDPSQQVARLDGDAIRQGVEAATYLVCNEYEFEIIMSKTGLSREEIIAMVPTVIVTLGENGAAIHENGKIITVPVFAINNIVDPTGVGDAFRGGLLRGMAAGFDWTLCGQMGALCAAYVLENIGTQSHNFTLEAFITRFRTQFDDGGKLDALL